MDFGLTFIRDMFFNIIVDDEAWISNINQIKTVHSVTIHSSQTAKNSNKPSAHTRFTLFWDLLADFMKQQMTIM